MRTRSMGSSDEGREGLEDVAPGEGASAEVGDVAEPWARMRTSLTHSDGWNCMWPRLRDPAARAEDLMAEDADGDEGNETDTVGPGRPVEESMVVELGEEEHHDDAAADVEELLGVEADVLGVERGGIDFEDGDSAEGARPMAKRAQSNSR